MQKTIIAAAIIGLVSVGASAATVYDKDGTKISLGGKFDFALEYKDAGNKQTQTILDGKYSTSRLTFGYEEAITSDLTGYFSVDMRFNNIFTGKNSATNGGLSTNDAKKGGLVSKKFGRFEAGVINVAAQQFVFKKNYVNKSESELVKYGVASMGLEALSNRTVYAHTSSALPVVLKASYSYSDAQEGDVAGNKGHLLSYGIEGKYSIVNAGAAVVVKKSNGVAVANGMKHYEGFIAAEQAGKKLSFFASHDSNESGVAGATGAHSGRGFGLNAYYLIGDKIDLGAQIGRYNDRSGGVENSGKGYMLGAHYYMSKATTFFAGTRFDNWDKDGGKAGKIVGTAANFEGTMTKSDQRTVFGGFNLAF